MTCDGADTKLLKQKSGTNKLAEFCKRHMVCDVSLQELTAELNEDKSQLVKIKTEKLYLPMILNAVVTDYDKRFNHLATARGTGDHDKKLAQSIVSQSIEALDALSFTSELCRWNVFVTVQKVRMFAVSCRYLIS